MVLLIGLLGAVLAATAVVAWHQVRRERTTRHQLDARLQAVETDRSRILQRRAVELDLEHALEHAESEDEVVDLVHRALVSIDPSRPFELHLVDAHEPTMRLAFATGASPEGGSDISSPWESVAARDGMTLVYDSTEVDDVCTHLHSRVVEPCSAIAIPLLAMGRIVGVLYAMGPLGAAPSARLVETYEVIARAAAAHVATVRGFARRDPPTDVHPDDIDLDLGDETIVIDELAGLDGRDEAMAAIDERITARAPFSVLVFDIDGFGLYQAQHGAAAGDAALHTLGSLAAHELGGSGHLYRLEGDRLLALLDEATARDALCAAEHIRGTLARDRRRQPEPPFTVSFGVVEASRGTSSERVLFAATDALYNARARGNDRTVLGVDAVVGNA